MELRPMQYKGFVWPHNPRTYTITYDRQVAVHKVPFLAGTPCRIWG